MKFFSHKLNFVEWNVSAFLTAPSKSVEKKEENMNHFYW